MPFDLDPQLIAILFFFGFLAAFIDSVVGGGGLIDEISPDTARLWDCNTKNCLDSDRFRRDLGEVSEAYREVLERLSSL